jgi:putative membrane protein
MKYNSVLLTVFSISMIISAIQPHDYFTWFLEVFPAFIGLGFIFFTNKKFPLTKFTLTCLLIHTIILMIGGHYTYAEVPFFNWIKDLFHQTRNNYDKIGHFAQGFFPALLIREVIIRKNVIQLKSWRNILIVSMCMAISTSYEFLEWGVALLSGEDADAFLGTQGYVWDTQSDMFYATCGAIVALILFSKMQDNKIRLLKLQKAD